MRGKIFLFAFLTFFIYINPIRADFGDADFPIGMFDDGPKSYHDAFCRFLENKCRIRFQGPAMWVEGQGGIQIDQFLSFRFDEDTGGYWSKERDFYNYVSSFFTILLFLFRKYCMHVENYFF